MADVQDGQRGTDVWSTRPLPQCCTRGWRSPATAPGHFNTFGNIEVNPRAGLLFIEFEQGNLLYLTGRAEVIWDGDPEIAAYAGAERLFTFHLTQGIRVEGSLPLTWPTPDYSRFLAKTGPW